MCYNVDDILPVCDELDLPLVVGPAVRDKSRNWARLMSVRLSSRLDLCELCPGALMKADPWHVSHRPNLRQLSFPALTRFGTGKASDRNSISRLHGLAQ